eukprot:g3448.t1
MGAYGELLGQLGRLAEARRLVEASLTMLHDVFGTTSERLNIAKVLERRGVVMRKLSLLKEARRDLEASLEMQYAVHPEGRNGRTKEIARTLHELGNVLYFLGDLKGAREKYEASLEMRYAVHPEGRKAKTEGIALTLHNIGNVLDSLGDPDGAREKYEASLEMRYAVHPEGRKAKTQSIASSLHNIGNVLSNLGNPKGALEKYEASLEMKYAIHPERRKAKTGGIADTLHSIGIVLDDLGDPKGALEKYEASLEMRYAIHPEGRKAKTQSIASSLHNIGIVLDDLGNPKGALEKYEASLEMKYAVHPEGRKAKTQGIAITLQCIGNVLSNLGDPKGALEKYEASLEMEYAIHPEGRKAKTQNIANTLHCIGIVLRNLGNSKGALEKYEASLEMSYAIHPDGRKAKTHSIAMTLHNIGIVLLNLGNPKGALENRGDVRGAVRKPKEMNAKGIEANAITYSTLMQAYASRGDVDGAEKILTQMKAKGLPANVIMYTTMIQTHCRRRDHAAAVRTLQKMLELNLKPDARTFTLCAHSFLNPKDDDAFWAGLRRLSTHPHALNTDNDFQASSFIFHPWIGAIPRDAQRNGSKPIHPLSVLNLAPNPTKWKPIDDALRRSKVRVIPASEISFDRLWFQGTSNTLGESGLKRVVSAVVNGKPYAVVTSKDAYDSDRNDDADADVSKEDTSASKPPSNSTSTPSSSFSTTTNRTEPTRRYTSASKSFTPEAVGVTSSSAQNDRVIISEITHTLALHDAPAALTIAFKVEGCPVYGLPLCALRSLNTLVRTRYGVRTDWITPNLEYAVDLWLRAMRAIHDVHRTGHVHLDIKSDNFLVDYTADDGLRLFIGDFGSVRKVDPDRHCVTKKLGGYTDPWGSPEVVLGSGRVGFAADIWSMACVGIEIFRGCTPWERSTLMKFQDGRGAEIEDLLASALRNMTTPLSHPSLHDAASFFERFDGFVGNGSSDVKVYRDVCDDLYALLTAMFDYDPSKRPSAEKAVGCLENAKQRLAGVHADDPFWHVRTKIQFRPSKDDIDAFAQRMGMDTTKQALSKEQHLSQRREAVSRMMMREERGVPERGGGVRHCEAKPRPWLRGVVKMYDVRRRFGFLLPMDGGKDIRFL